MMRVGWRGVQGPKIKNIHKISPSCGTWDCLCEHSGRDTGDTGGFLSLCGWPCVSSSSSCVWWPAHTQDTGMVCHHPQESLEGTTGHCYYVQRTFKEFQKLLISILEHGKNVLYVAEIYLHYWKEIKITPIQMQTTVFTDLQETTPAQLMVKTIKGNASWKQWYNGSKNSNMF